MTNEAIYKSFEIHLTNKYGIRQTVYISMDVLTALDEAQRYCQKEGSIFRKLVQRPSILTV